MKCSIERSRKVNFRSFGYGMIYFDTNLFLKDYNILTYCTYLEQEKYTFLFQVWLSPIWFFFNNTGAGGN